MTERSLMTVPFLWDRISFSPGYPWIHYIIKDDCELLISLPPPPKCWDYGLVSWCPADADSLDSIMEHRFVLLFFSFSGSHLHHSNISIVTQVLKMTISLNFLKGREILTLAPHHIHSFRVLPCVGPFPEWGLFLPVGSTPWLNFLPLNHLLLLKGPAVMMKNKIISKCGRCKAVRQALQENFQRRMEVKRKAVYMG